MLPNSVSYCRAEPSKVLAAAPRPRKRGRFRVAISDRPPSPPWDLIKNDAPQTTSYNSPLFRDILIQAKDHGLGTVQRTYCVPDLTPHALSP